MEPKPLLSVWGPPLACLAWKMLITYGREVNKKGACLKISFIFVLKIELWHLCKSVLPSAKGLSIYFYVFTFMQESIFFSLFLFFSFGNHHVVRKDLGTYIQLDMGSMNYYC